jgi:uncharacterized DUF497 family protein
VIFSWDPRKAAANLRKHGVDFREAATVFDDPFSTTYRMSTIQFGSDGS